MTFETIIGRLIWEVLRGNVLPAEALLTNSQQLLIQSGRAWGLLLFEMRRLREMRELQRPKTETWQTVSLRLIVRLNPFLAV